MARCRGRYRPLAPRRARSCERLLREPAEMIQVEPPRERGKALRRAVAIPEIGAEQSLDATRHIIGCDIRVEEPRNRGVGAKAAADMEVIALHLIALAADAHL